MLKDYKNKIKLISINTLSYTLIAFFSIVLVFLSVYNIETKNFFWQENKNNLANLINLFAAISGFLGVISIYLFCKEKANRIFNCNIKCNILNYLFSLQWFIDWCYFKLYIYFNNDYYILKS